MLFQTLNIEFFQIWVKKPWEAWELIKEEHIQVQILNNILQHLKRQCQNSALLTFFLMFHYTINPFKVFFFSVKHTLEKQENLE